MGMKLLADKAVAVFNCEIVVSAMIIFIAYAINNMVNKCLLLIPMMLLTSCSPTKCPVASLPAEDKQRYNTEEPTLQSAADANTQQFTPESFK